MLEETLQETVARLYRGMTPEAIAIHEGWVRRFNASDKGKAAAAARDAARLEKISRGLVMTDREVVAEVAAIIQRVEGIDAAL